MINILLLLDLIDLTAENFTARLKEAYLMTKIDFNKKLTSFDRKITSNKTKYLEVSKEIR